MKTMCSDQGSVDDSSFIREINSRLRQYGVDCLQSMQTLFQVESIVREAEIVFHNQTQDNCKRLNNQWSHH